MCVAATAAVVGTGYNVYSGIKNAKAADEWSDQQAASLNALTKLTQQQWDHYKTTYKPLIQKAVKRANEALPSQPMEDKASAAVTRAAAPMYGKALSALSSAGVAPTSGNARQALQDAVNRAAVTEAGARTDARTALNDTMFNRRVGIATTGRGMPGQIMSGYGNLAQQSGTLASGYSELAGKSFGSAIDSAYSFGKGVTGALGLMRGSGG